MKLWTQWLRAVCALRPACRRARPFAWMVLVLMGWCCRADNAGVTSFVRVLNFSGQAYHRLRDRFHNTRLDPDVLTSCGVRLCLRRALKRKTWHCPVKRQVNFKLIESGNSSRYRTSPTRRVSRAASWRPGQPCGCVLTDTGMPTILNF